MERHPTTYRLEEVLLEQVQDQDHGACMFNGEQVNDHIEQDDHADDVIEDDGKIGRASCRERV